MTEEEYKKIRITRDDLLDWIDKPPSNSDIELADYIVNALDNQFKYFNIIEKARKLKANYVCTEEYCGKVGIETTYFIEKLGKVLDEVKENKKYDN